MNTRDLAATMRRRAWLIVIPTVAAALVAVVSSALSTPYYRSSAEVVVSSTDHSFTAELEIAGGSELRSEVRLLIGGEPDLLITGASDVLRFIATSSDAENAAVSANTFADVYVADRGDRAEIVNRASAQSKPYTPTALRNALLAALTGLIIGIIAALIAGFFDTTLRSAHQLKKVAGVPNLAMIPRQPLGHRRPDDVVAFRDPNSIEAEAYRTLSTTVEFLCRSSGAKVILVTGPRPREGKSSVAAELAAALAKAGRNVVLVDADLRRPQVHHLFGLHNECGLSSILRGEATVEQAVQRFKQEDHLAVLPAGAPPPDPAELLAHERLELTLKSLAEASDMVVIDAPPILPVTDPMILAQHADVTLMVATAGISDRREWAEAMRRLTLIDAEVIGTVLQRPDPRVEALPSYGYAPTAIPEQWWVKGVDADCEPTEGDGESVAAGTSLEAPTQSERDATFWNRTGSPQPPESAWPGPDDKL